MAISPRLLAVLQKVDAARAEHFDGLRESAKRDEQLRVEKRKKQMTNAQKKPPRHVVVANRADHAGLVVQDIARSAVKKPVHAAACTQCHRVISAATLKLLDTKYKAHLRTCRRAGLA